MSVFKVLRQDDEGWDDIDELLAQDLSRDSPSVSNDDSSIDPEQSTMAREDGIVEYNDDSIQEKREIKFEIKKKAQAKKEPFVVC